MSKYHKGDKFIVEIKEVINSDNGTLYRSNFSTLVFDDYGLDSLHQAVTPAEDSLIDKSKVEEVYIKGLNDAWELARKIVLDVSEGGMPERDMISMFGEKWTVSDILKNYTPQEALAKLEAYEKEQNKIKAGYIYEIMGKFCAVVQVDEFNKEYHIIWCDGGTDKIPFDAPIGFKKTGKHIDIQSLLEQIKE